VGHSHGSALRAIREAVGAVDARGRFPPGTHLAVREAIDTVREAVPDHPAQLFGSWASLSPEARAALRSLVETDTWACARLHPRDGLRTGLVRGLRELDRHLAAGRHARRLRPLLVRTGERAHDGPLNAWRRGTTWLRRRRWNSSRPVDLGGVLAALGRDPRWLLGDFVEGVRQAPGARSFFDDCRRNVVHGYHIGFDLMPTPQGICCVEANLRAGIDPDRTSVIGGQELVGGAVSAALAHGARRLIWVESQRMPLPDWAVEDLAAHARAAGIRLEILEDPCMPVVRHRRGGAPIGHYRVLDHLPDHTLVLHRDEMLAGPDFLVTHKEPSIRALDSILRALGERRVFVLPMTREPQVDQSADPGLPNVVYKYPDTWAGAGVHFMKARDAAHATEMARRIDRERGEPPGLFQRFISPILGEDRRAHDVRAEIFLTPRETRFVRALRREAGHRIPERIDHGLVTARGVYSSNLGTGGRHGPVPEGDREAIRAAAVAVGDALRLSLASTFITEAPPRPDSCE
jgi:hypothetical protein